MAHTTPPTGQNMSSSNAAMFDVLPGEATLHAFESYDMAGKAIKGMLTDRRLILRASEGVCGFPLDLCCICFKAEVDSSYSIMDMKNVKPYVASGCVANCMSTMFNMATTWPFCCCLPKLLPNGVNIGFSRPASEYVPFSTFPWLTGQGPSYNNLRLQLHREDAIQLRRLLVTHPNAKGLGYTVLGK